MYTKKKCNPGNKLTYSCLYPKLLKKIAKILNINNKLNSKTIHKLINNKVKNISKCKSEECWITINKIINNLNQKEITQFKNSFRPQKPLSWYKNKNEWLSSSDIDNVLKQYEKKYKKFKYYESTPIDFNLKNKKTNQCEVSDLCKFNLKKLIKNKKTKIGLVFNTDYHDEPGSHWVSLYIDINGINMGHPSIFFFDSTGDDAQEEVYDFIDLVKTQGGRIGVDFKSYINKKIHQIKDTECGIYCLHFITSMLLKKDFNKYMRNIKNDNYMEKFRNFFYIDNINSNKLKKKYN